MTPNDLIITGTDTGVGKTIVSAVLALKFKLDYWKPVQTGSPTDTEWIKETLGPARVHPEGYRLTLPLSPHLAARHERLTIDLKQILKRRPARPAVIEGAGGVLVPLNDREFLVDLFREFNAPLIVVAQAKLGAINHTLLTLEALRRRSLDPTGFILIGPDSKGSREAICEYGKIRCLASLPWLEEFTPQAILQVAQRLEIHL